MITVEDEPEEFDFFTELVFELLLFVLILFVELLFFIVELFFFPLKNDDTSENELLILDEILDAENPELAFEELFRELSFTLLTLAELFLNELAIIYKYNINYFYSKSF
jgi:hypothetical protein